MSDVFPCIEEVSHTDSTDLTTPKTRKYIITSKDKYKIPSQGLIASWRFINQEETLPEEKKEEKPQNMKEEKSLREKLREKIRQKKNSRCSSETLKKSENEEQIENKVLDKTNQRPINKIYIPKLRIDTEIIDFVGKDELFISAQEIRSYLRSLLPETRKLNKMILLEDRLFRNQLGVIDYFSHLPNEILNNTICTVDMNIYFDFGVKGPRDKVYIEETYYEPRKKD